MCEYEGMCTNEKMGMDRGGIWGFERAKLAAIDVLMKGDLLASHRPLYGPGMNEQSLSIFITSLLLCICQDSHTYPPNMYNSDFYGAWSMISTLS